MYVGSCLDDPASIAVFSARSPNGALRALPEAPGGVIPPSASRLFPQLNLRQRDLQLPLILQIRA